MRAFSFLLLAIVGCDSTEIRTAEVDAASRICGPTSVGYMSTMDHIAPSEEFTFFEDELLNIPDGGDVTFRARKFGTPMVGFPYASREIGAVRALADGDLLIADEAEGTIVRLGREDGSIEVVISGLERPNSMAVGPDDQVFVGDVDRLFELDLETGEPALVVSLPGVDFDGLALDNEGKTLYFNDDLTGSVWRQDLESGVRTLIATLDNFGVWGPRSGEEGGEDRSGSTGSDPGRWEAPLDGMAVDECGNLYVVRMSGEIFRISTDDVVTHIAELPSEDVLATAAHFGTGFGGWERGHLYVMNRRGVEGGVVELRE